MKNHALSLDEKIIRCGFELERIENCLEQVCSVPISMLVWGQGNCIKVSPILAPYIDSILRRRLRTICRSYSLCEANGYLRQSCLDDARDEIIYFLVRMTAIRNAYYKASNKLAEMENKGE